MMIFWLGILIGIPFGFLFTSVLISGEDDVNYYKEGMKDFAMYLKARVQKPEYPWEDFFICESDIDEVLKEMGCDE